jgi:hypothetical protein
MRAFTIEFQNFGVVVHHRTATTVVFGSAGHDLRFRKATPHGPDAWAPVPKDVTIMLRVLDAQGAEVQSGPVTSHTGSYMLDLNWAFNGKLPIDKERVTGNNRNDQNARVRLHGGHLFDHPAINEADEEHDLANALWSFEAFGAPAPSLHRVTNRISFVHLVEKGFTYALSIDGSTVALDDMTIVTFENRDRATKYDCDDDIMRQIPGAIDREFPTLLPAVGIDAAGAYPRLAVVAPFEPPPDKICEPCGIPGGRVDFD